MEILPALESDAQVLADLGRTTFIDTFAKDNKAEDIELYVQETFGFEQQSKELLDPSRIIAIAWQQESAVGFFHLVPSTPHSSVRYPKPIELLRFYLDARLHGRGLGAKLMDHCLATACDAGFESIWLGVWEHNIRAQSFYRKFQFEVVGSHPFKLGNDIQTDWIMARKI